MDAVRMAGPRKRVSADRRLGLGPPRHKIADRPSAISGHPQRPRCSCSLSRQLRTFPIRERQRPLIGDHVCIFTDEAAKRTERGRASHLISCHAWETGIEIVQCTPSALNAKEVLAPS